MPKPNQELYYLLDPKEWLPESDLGPMFLRYGDDAETLTRELTTLLEGGWAETSVTEEGPSWRATPRLYKGPGITCCGPAREHTVIKLWCPIDSQGYPKPGEPMWVLPSNTFRGVSAMCCPFCATPVPRVRLKAALDRPTCNPVEGGLCGTCRLDIFDCICSWPESAYEIVPNT